MKSIDLQKIMDARALTKKEVAAQLFPNNSYPVIALTRILTGKALLDSDQISRLSLLTSLTIDELYGSTFKGKAKKDLITWTDGNITAILDRTTWVTKIFDKATMFHESIIHTGATPLEGYLSAVTKLVTEYKQKQSTPNT